MSAQFPFAHPSPNARLAGRRGAPPPRFSTLASLACGLALVSACGFVDAGGDLHPTVRATGPEPAVSWSELAYDIAYAEDQFLTFKGQRAIAMMHLAMHDALQAIVPVYEPYLYEERARDADPVAAATTAAYEVLVAAYPDRAAVLDSARMRWLDSVSDGHARRAGIELGSAAARAVIEQRSSDGWTEQGTYTFRSGPGEYQTTPPWDGFTLVPAFGEATPFSFEDPESFRPPPPPALDSPEYAEALNEVREQGDSLSSVRTADQTGYALWWMEFSESAVGRIARKMLSERGSDLWATNRVLAHLYVALVDSYVATWDSKYTYNHWRPYTAIRAADTDGNDATEPDPDWVPLRTTPPFPEYVSAHAAGCGAAYAVMAAAFGDDTPFENTSLTQPPGMSSRSFPSFDAAAEECADSRVRLGWHFRYATNAGLDLGRSIARHVMTSMLRRR